MGKSIFCYNLNEGDQVVKLMVNWTCLTLAQDLYIGWICHADPVACKEEYDFVVRLLNGDEVITTWTGPCLKFSPYFDTKDGFTFTRYIHDHNHFYTVLA